MARAAERGALLLLALLVRAVPARAAQVGLPSFIVERPESDIILLAVKLDQSILAEGLPSYQDRGRVLVPLGEVCRLLGLGIGVDVVRGLASGFFIDQERIFRLDVVGRKVSLAGKAKRFDPAGIEVHRDDIYVDTALLSDWLPLQLEVDLHGSMIVVRPGERLPLQLRSEREKQLERSRASQDLASSGYPKIEQPYKLFDGSFVDQTLGFTRQSLPGGGSQSGLQSSTYATGDLLFAEANAYISASERGIADLRLSLGRKDPDGNLLGILGAREIALGDVFHPGLDLIAVPRSGPGLLVSNFPLQLPTQFDRQSFRGDLPPGWEVELYRGDQLLAYAQSRSDGLYEFLDVPLLFGANAFRLEFFGPQGQRRKESRTLNVGDTLTPKGQVYYRLAGNDPGYHLAGAVQAVAGPRWTLEMSAGLTRNLSASASIATVDLLDGQHTYGEAGLRAFWGWLFANVDFAVDGSRGSAWQGSLQSRFGAFGFLVQDAELRGFESEAFDSAAGALTRRTSVRVDTVVPKTFLPPMTLILELKQDQLENGQRVDQLTGRISAFRSGFFVSNQLDWNLTLGPGAPASPGGYGQLLVSKLLQAFALRGEIDYGIKPRAVVTGVLLTAETRLVRGFLFTTGINRLFSTGETRFLAGASKLEGAFGFNLTASWSHQSGLGASLLVSTGIGRDPRNGSWHTQARPLAGFGAVSGRAFLDANGNGVMDDGEKPISGAGFLVNGSGNLARTNEAGEAFMPNLAPYQAVALSLAPSTIEDPFWKPQEGVRLVPRPGKVAVVDFPVQVYGEITGTIYLRRDGKSHATSGVELELADRQGVVVKKVRSAYDGFYDLAEIKPGSYTLRVSEHQVPKPGPAAAARAVVMAASGTVLDGIDFVLDEEPAGGP